MKPWRESSVGLFLTEKRRWYYEICDLLRMEPLARAN
jgi:hypothetical protein